MKPESKFNIGDQVIDHFERVGNIINFIWCEHLDSYMYQLKQKKSGNIYEVVETQLNSIHGEL